MEDIRKVKTIINRLNRTCDKEKCSISSVLTKWQMQPIGFLKMLGLDESLINESSILILNDLLNQEDTRFVFDPGMTSIEHNEIEIYSKNLRVSFVFLSGEIKIIKSFSDEDESYTYDTIEFLGTRKGSENNESIQFYLKKHISKEDRKSRIITQKYPVKHLVVGVTYSRGTVTDIFEITINNDMLLNDLNYIEQLLYQYRCAQAKNILLNYPAEIKIISDTLSLHNFNNR